MSLFQRICYVVVPEYLLCRCSSVCVMSLFQRVVVPVYLHYVVVPVTTGPEDKKRKVNTHPKPKSNQKKVKVEPSFPMKFDNSTGDLVPYVDLTSS